MPAVTVRSKLACVQCDATYRALDSNGIPYDMIDLTQDTTPSSSSALSATSRPVVVAGDKLWSGFPSRPDHRTGNPRASPRRSRHGRAAPTPDRAMAINDAAWSWLRYRARRPWDWTGHASTSLSAVASRQNTFTSSKLSSNIPASVTPRTAGSRKGSS